MIKNILCISFLLMSVSLTSRADVIGGPCIYDKVPGTITITHIGPLDEPSWYQCKFEPADIQFEFSADEPERDFPAPYMPSRYYHIGGMFPSLLWAYDNGVVVGNIYRASKMRIISGTCSPFEYSVPELDDMRIPSYCY